MFGHLERVVAFRAYHKSGNASVDAQYVKEGVRASSSSGFDERSNVQQ